MVKKIIAVFTAIALVAVGVFSAVMYIRHMQADDIIIADVTDNIASIEVHKANDDGYWNGTNFYYPDGSGHFNYDCAWDK